MNPTSNFPFSYCNHPRISVSSIKTVEEGTMVIKDLLERDVLCSHDIKDLRRVYQFLNELKQKADRTAHTDSQGVLTQIVQRVQMIHQDLSGKEIISSYHLRQFEISLINQPFNPSFPLTLTIEKIKEIAAHLPYCGRQDDFETDVAALLGAALTEEVQTIIQDRKDQIHKREEIEKRLRELQQLREKDASLYPLYLEEILDRGFFPLYDHLIKMKKLTTQAERETEEKDISFSALSHIVLGFKEMVLAQAEKLIPQGSKILFLLGDTGSGKSTTLCYLRTDPLVLQNDNYQSLAPGEDLIGNNGKISSTLFPNIDVSSDLTLVDFPGFNDTHGKVIALAVELSLRALVKKYSPKILILSSITDTESRFNHALRLGERLKRILGTLDHCILGLTKYSKDPDFIKITNIEIQQLRQQKEFSNPSREESVLEGSLQTLLSLVGQMPGLQGVIDQKKEELSKLQKARQLLSTDLLPDTEEKKFHLKNLREKEKIFKEMIGIQKMISLANLTDQRQLEQLLNTFKLSQNISSFPKYHSLDPADKDFLSILFRNKLVKLITSREDRSLSASKFNFSQGELCKNELLGEIKKFEKSTLETSLINTLLLNAYPEIGQFFHLEEMDPTVVRNFDKEVIEKCIQDYINEVISDITVLQEIIEKSKEEFSKAQNKAIEKKLSSLKKYILTVSLGIPEKADEMKVVQAWESLQKEHESRIKTRKKDLEISRSMAVALIVALGIPYGVFALLKKNALNQTHMSFNKDLASELCERMQDISQAIEHLKEIERAVKDKDRFDEVFAKNPLLLDSISSLRTSLDQQIDQVKNIYGKVEWERRVAILMDQLQRKFRSQKEEVLYSIMSQQVSWKELPPYVNEHTFLALMHSFSASQGSYQESLKQLIPDWEAAYFCNLKLSKPNDFFYEPGIRKEGYEELKVEGKLLLEQYQKTAVTKLLLIDVIKRLRVAPSYIDEYKSRKGDKAWNPLNFSLSNDKEKILSAVKGNAWILEYSKEWLLKDKEFILTAVQQNEKVLMFISDDLKNDPDFFCSAVEQNVKAFEFASEKLKNDYSMILALIKKDWKVLKHVNERFQNDHKFILNAISQIHDSSEDLHPVIDYYEEDLKHALEQTNRLEEGKAYGNLGIVYQVLGQYQTAIIYHQKMLDIALELGNIQGKRIAYIHLGDIYYKLGNHQDAIEYYQKALEIALELKEQSSERFSYINLADIYHEIGDYPGMIMCHKKELESALESRSEMREWVAYGNLGNAYCKLGEYQEAILYYKKILKIALGMKYRLGEQIAYVHLGIAYYGFEDSQEAITYYQKALEIALGLKDQQSESAIYARLGAIYQKLGDWQTAINYAQKNLKIAIELKDWVLEGDAYGNLGAAYEKLGDYRDAITYHEKELKIALDRNDMASEVRAYDQLGAAYEKLGDYRGAITYYEKELKIALGLNYEAVKGRAYGNLGAAYEGMGDYEKAIIYHEKGLKIFLDSNDELNTGRAYGNLGVAYEGMGDYKNAITYHEKELKIALDLKGSVSERRAHNNLGVAYQKLGDYRRAVAHHEKALKMALELKDLASEGKAYNNLGIAYQQLGDYRRAVAYHDKALKMALELKDLASEGRVYNNLGVAYQGLGDYTEAVTHHEKNLEIALKLNDRVSEGRAYGHLGAVYQELGDYRSVITYHEKSLKIALKLNDRVGEGRAYGHLGAAYQALGDYKRAIKYHEKSLEINLNLSDLVSEGRSYGNLGAVYQELGDYRSAITYHEKNLKIALELSEWVSEGKAYDHLGAAYQKLGDYREAIIHYEKGLKMALELKDRVSEGRAYDNLGSTYQKLGDYRSAIIYHERHLKIALELKDRVSEGRAYNNLGNTYLLLEEIYKAGEYFQRGIKISAILQHQVQEAELQISLFEEWSQSYKGLEYALLKQGKHHEALEGSDQRRARALSSLISKKLSLNSNSDSHLEALTVQQMQDLARKLDTTFIIYSLISLDQLKPSFQAWIVSAEGTSIQSISLPIPEQESLNREQIFKEFPYHVEIRRPQRGEKQPNIVFQEKLSFWYKSLIAPLEPYLPVEKSGETLTFILDDFLAHLPFGAFYNKEKDCYLIENYPISVAPSMQVLSLLDQLPKNVSKEAFLLGNPTTPIAQNNHLEMAELEVRRIADMINLPQDQVLTREKATPSRVLKNGASAQFIHIASQGVPYLKPLEQPDPHSVFEGLFKLAIDEDHPLGHLHAKEIASSSLKADLVFMSACHLGRGNLKQEGSVGPVWSFLGAGAKSTIASYWAIFEGKTMDKIVKTFYQHYLGIDAPKLNKAKALQQAILIAMKTERNKPHQWAGLFLTGLIE